MAINKKFIGTTIYPPGGDLGPQVVYRKQTSADWERELLNPINFQIYDPDGWDRKNYQYSFNEEIITRDEFLSRLMRSTVGGDFQKLMEICK